MIGIRIVAGFAIAAGMLVATDLQLSGPVTGIIFTPATRSLRPIVGYPGAAYIGPSIVSGVEWAAVSPSGERALVRGSEGLSLYESLRSGSPRSQQIYESAVDVLAAWSADSNSLAILFRDENKLLVRHLQTEREIEIPRGNVRGLAISDGGHEVLLAVAGGDGGAIWQFSSGMSRRVPLAGIPANVSFTRDRRDALILDESGAQLHWVQDVRGAAAVVPVKFTDNGEAAIFSIADAGGGRVLALDKARRRAWLIELASGRFAAEAQLDSAPDSVVPLAQPFLFAAGGGSNSGDPVNVLSTRSRLDAFFVPHSPE